MGGHDLYGDILVWQEYIEDSYDIFAMNLSTRETIQITDDEVDQKDPAVYGHRIIWVDHRNEFQDIYMYDLITGIETRITEDNYNQGQPDIYENKIFWGNYPDSVDRSATLYDIDTKEEMVLFEGITNVGYSMYGNYIAYMGSSGQTAIRLLDLDSGEEKQISSTVTQAWEPQVYQDKVVYFEYNFVNSGVYLYNISNSTQIRLSKENITTNQMKCSIWENYVVWEDNREGTMNCYLYDLNTGEEMNITNDDTGNFCPIIHNDTIVWARQVTSGSDFFMVRLDRDNDGVGDHSDDFPDDPQETIDTDNDGVGDNSDAFPEDPLETVDTDDDGTGDNSDSFLNDPAASMDSDLDGYPDRWNDGRSEIDSSTGLILDEYPDDTDRWESENKKETSIIPMILGAVFIFIIIVVVFVLLLMKKKKDDEEQISDEASHIPLDENSMPDEASNEYELKQKDTEGTN